MQGKLLSLGFLVLFLAVLIDGFQTKVDMGAPVAAWGPGAGNTQVFSNLFSAQDLQRSLLSVLGLEQGAAEDFVSPFASLETAPEIVVFFVEPELSTQDLLVHTGAHSALVAVQEAPLTQLRRTIDSSNSVFLTNLALQYTELSEILATVANAQLAQHITSSLLIASDNSDEFALSLLPLFPERATHLALDQLEEHLAQNPQLGTNGVTDLVLVYLASNPLSDNELPAKLRQDDSKIASTIDSVVALTPDYLAFFSSEFSPATYFTGPEAEHYARIIARSTHNGTTTYPSRFPPSVAQGLMTAAVLLLILFVGLCCLCYTQTPDRFPEAVREGQPNPHILYPNKQ